MKLKNTVISIMIGGVIGVLLFGYGRLYNENIKLSNDYLQEKSNYEDLSTKYSKLNEDYVNLTNEKLEPIINQAQRELILIEPLKKYDKKEYLTQYKNILSTYYELDPPETIYDYTTDEEFDLLCKVVEAEIGIGDFDQKCNVASSIINRYLSEAFPNGWKELLFQKENGTYQYSTIGNKSYKKAKVSKDTILAIEYTFLIEDTTNGCTYFHSGNSSWHKNNLEFVFDDGLHKFYKEKGEE